jgi:nucleotide-binding universal stress UspA family protein
MVQKPIVIEKRRWTGTDRRPVLVPVDFSNSSEVALLFAAQTARCIGAPLLILHVVHEPVDQPGFYRKNGDAGSLRPMEDVARDMLKRFVDEMRRHEWARAALEDAEVLLVTGLPIRRIEEVAQQRDAAMIVMGTQGRGGLARLARRSVTEELAKHSPIPVTVVKAPAEGEKKQAFLESMASAGWWDRRIPSPVPEPTESASA